MRLLPTAPLSRRRLPSAFHLFWMGLFSDSYRVPYPNPPLTSWFDPGRQLLVTVSCTTCVPGIRFGLRASRALSTWPVPKYISPCAGMSITPCTGGPERVPACSASSAWPPSDVLLPPLWPLLLAGPLPPALKLMNPDEEPGSAAFIAAGSRRVRGGGKILSAHL